MGLGWGAILDRLPPLFLAAEPDEPLRLPPEEAVRLPPEGFFRVVAMEPSFQNGGRAAGIICRAQTRKPATRETIPTAQQ